MSNVRSPVDAQLQCTFLSGFTGSARCTVRYGTDPTYIDLPYSAESTEIGTAGDTVSVILRERLNSSTVYYYTVSAVSGDIMVTVQGNFTTPEYSKYVASFPGIPRLQFLITCSIDCLQYAKAIFAPASNQGNEATKYMYCYCWFNGLFCL